MITLWWLTLLVGCAVALYGAWLVFDLVQKLRRVWRLREQLGGDE